MFKCHGHVSFLRGLCDHPTCPICLKHYHTMQKLKAHLYHSAACRDQLLSGSWRCPIVPGSGSIDDQARTQEHDRLLPPLLCHGPHRPALRLREHHDIDQTLQDFLVDFFATEVIDERLFEMLYGHLSTCEISWTRMTRTMCHFADALSRDDAQLLGFDFDMAQETLRRLTDPMSWPFLCEDVMPHRDPGSIDVLEDHCLRVRDLLRQYTCNVVPRPFGRCRVLLHLFSGRRRRGDVQYFLEQMMDQHTDFDLLVISLDIVIDSEYGDATKPETCEFWLGAIREGMVLGMLAGPPCESWSRARAVPLEGITAKHGPRIIRDVQHLWGFPSVTIKELFQLCTGNALLGFAILAFLELVFVGGLSLLEHPAEPCDDQNAASIWRLPLLQVLKELPNVTFIRFAQG